MDRFNLITHYDMDGVGAFILTRSIPQFHERLNKVYPCGYPKITKYIEKSVNEVSNLLITDLAVTQEHADLIKKHFKKSMLVDHHPSTESLEYPHTKVFDIKKSGSMLTFEKFAKMSNLDTKKYSRLIELINDYDIFELKHEASLWLNEVYWKYGFWDFAEIFKDGLNEQYLMEGKEIWKEKEKDWERSDKMIIGDTYILFGTGFLTNAMILNPTNIISVNSSKKLSIRSRNKLFNFYDSVKSTFGDSISSVGGHAYAGGLEFIEDVTDKDLEKIYTLLEE